MIHTDATKAPPAVPIPMVDLETQYLRIKGEIDEAIEDVLASTRFIKGPVVAAFEEELATHLGGNHALGVANGTDALQVALMALGVGPGDEVITPAFSFVAAAEMVALLGAQPIFAEIDAETFNISVEHAASLVTNRTAAIIPVHLYGQAADMDGIMQLAERHGIPVIEDAAQAVGSRHRERPVGYIGRIGTLSFFPSKNLGCYGDGGAVLTNDPAVHRRMAELANHGARQKYRNEQVGLNSRLDAIQAAILRVKLRYLDTFTDARQAAAQRYDQLFAGMPEIVAPVIADDATHVFHQYTIRLRGRDAETRDALATFLKTREIATAVYYPAPLYHFEAYRDGLRGTDRLVETERACQEVISLPMHTELREEQQIRIVDEIAAFLGEYRNG
ncbi:MAG: DegT/DnrJ/EryC1/StrS family aminotransferase [Rhodothermales bacterium]